MIIARISFTKKRVSHGTHLLRFLTQIVIKYGYEHLGIQSTNNKSILFARKLGLKAIDGLTYVVSVKSLID
ncbi:hypothetical protein DCPSUM001_29380 [Dysgonomonas capnocytophagoides]|nr:hypothetical protein DCPSUM001_29380 [Dysgonomonas capnocytophagoides]